jgi:hypothetical protein
MANVIEIVIKAKDDASKVLQGVGANMQTIGKIALGGPGTAATAVAGLGVAVTKLAMDAAPLQQIESAFAGLAESAGSDMDEMLAALQQGSAGMVTNRDLMLSFNKAAQLVGQDFAVQLPDAMQYLGKVSAATGQDMGFLLDSLVVGVGRLSPMILDNLGIQVSLAEASEEAAKMFGVEASQLTKAQQQAGMMNVVLAKLATNTASMPDVAGSAAAGIANLGVMFQNTKDEIGTAFLPILGEALGIISQLAERFLPPLLEKVQQLGELLLPVAEAIGDFVGRILAGQDPLTSFKVLLMELLPPDLFFKVLEIIDGIEQFVGKVTEAFAPIAAWIGQNVQLSDILIALGATIATVIVPALVSIIAAAAPVIGTFLLVVATVAALRAAWESDFLGIRTALENAWAAILPVIESLWAWLQEKVPAAIETLRGFWENTLLPAINTVWEFVKTNVIPLFEALGELLSVAVSVAVTALAGLWENVLLPALKTAGNWIRDTLGPILESFRGWLDKVTGGAEGISAAFEKVIGWVESLTGKLKDIKLPEWMTPGSPTPLEIGLLGISDAFDKATAQAGGLIGELQSAKVPEWMIPGALGLSDNALLPARAASRAALSAFDYARDGTLATGGGNQYATSHIYIERVVIENANNATDLLQQLQQMAVM